MSNKLTKNVLNLLLVLLFLLTGCGGERGTSNKTMEIPELGVSMKIPAGWERDDSGLCHKGEYNTGMLLQEPLDGRNFEDVASDMSTEYGAEVVSTKNMQINGYDAIRTHIKMPDGVNGLRVYIHKGDNIITVSFVIESDEAYSKYEQSLLDAINSIKINK